MESKGKELLPKIQSVIDSLRQAKPPPMTNSGKRTKTKDGEDIISSKSGVEFDLSLPIDLPGLVTSSYPSPTAAKRLAGTSGTESKASRVKSKHVDSSTKEAKSGGTRVKTQSSNGKVDTSAVKDGKVREEVKEEKAAEKCLIADEPTAGVKEKDKRASRTKRLREEVKDKGVQETSKGESAELGSDERVERNRDGDSASVPSSKEVDEHDNSNGKKNEQEKKQLPARRRSARIASLTEDPRKNDNSDIEDEKGSREQHQKRRPSDGGEQDVQQLQTKAGKKKPSSKARVPTRKRARVWVDSSSEESDDDYDDGRSKRKKITSVLEVKVTKVHVRSKEKSGYRRLGTRKHQQDSDQETAREDPVKRSTRRLSKTGSPSSLTNTATDKSDNPPSSSRRKSNHPQKLPVTTRASKSPIKSPPPVVTRFNRQVKPNRKYYDEQDEMESGGEKVSEESGRSEMEYKDGTSTCSSDNDTITTDNEKINANFRQENR